MIARRPVAAALALLFVTGCATSSSPTLPPSAAPEEPQTPWQRAIERSEPDGRYTLHAALNLFATAYGPLPGVAVEQDLRGEDAVDGNIAIAAVMSHLAELTPEQRAAIDAYLAPPTDADVITIPPVAESAAAERLAMAGFGDAVAALEPDVRKAYEDAAKGFRSQIARKLGRDFAGDIKVFFKDTASPDSASSLADAWSDWPGGVFGDCHIRVYPRTQTREPLQIISTIAHETFHCFQLDAFRTIDSYAIEPKWVVEGQATWVQAVLASGEGCCEARWDQWLESQVDRQDA